MKKVMQVCLITLLAAMPALAVDNPWIGSWKLDPAKSKFAGDTFTVSKAAGGKMHYSDGSTTSYDFAVDGKAYNTAFGHTSAWSAAGDNSWDEVVMGNGRQLVKNHYVLSADGKTLSISYTGTKPDGTSFDDSATYVRVTGTKGLAGKWRSTKVTVSAPDQFIVSMKGGGVVHWDIPGYKETIEGKMDGSDLPVSGPTVPEGMTVSLKATTPKSIHYIVKVKGKPIAYGVQTLSADNKSFTDVSWSAGKMNEKATGFYAKE